LRDVLRPPNNATPRQYIVARLKRVLSHAVTLDCFSENNSHAFDYEQSQTALPRSQRPTDFV
jgi:hypothetical protein